MRAFLTPLVRAKYLKRVIKLLVHLHDTRHVVAPVAVVRRGPNCYQVFVVEPGCVALLRELMGPGD